MHANQKRFKDFFTGGIELRVVCLGGERFVLAAKDLKRGCISLWYKTTEFLTLADLHTLRDKYAAAFRKWG